jgi:uncharacterized protein
VTETLQDAAHPDEGRLVAHVTLGGVLAAAALMLAGVARLPFVPAAPDRIHPTVGALAEAFLRADPVAWCEAGCLLLIATPIVRTALLAASFLARGNPRFAAVALVVLATLVMAIAVS